MNRLPYSRVVNVNVSRNDRFPSRRGFGTQLILTTLAVAGQVDATRRTKLYATLAEVAVDYPSDTEAYRAAETAFSQNPRPLRVKIGYVNATVALTEDTIKTQLNAINDFDTAWYVLTITSPMRDQAYLDGLIEWVEAQNKQAFLDSNAVTMTDPSDTTNIAARHKGTVERTSVFWSDKADEYLGSAFAAYMTTRNFDDVNSHYTMKFKKARGVSPSNIGSAALTAVTGFIEALGQQESSGHCANAYVDIGDQDLLVEGSTLTQNVFIDEIHATDWLIARTEEETLGLFLNNARIPFTQQGLEQIASVAKMIMQLGVRAGIVAEDINPDTGDYEAAYTIEVPSIFDVPESQRKARIAPAIVVRFRFPGAVHYTTINYFMSY